MLALIAAAAAALPGAPLAAPAAMPRYERGDAFVFSDGRVERVIAADGEPIALVEIQPPGPEGS